MPNAARNSAAVETDRNNVAFRGARNAPTRWIGYVPVRPSASGHHLEFIQGTGLPRRNPPHALAASLFSATPVESANKVQSG